MQSHRYDNVLADINTSHDTYFESFFCGQGTMYKGLPENQTIFIQHIMIVETLVNSTSSHILFATIIIIHVPHMKTKNFISQYTIIYTAAVYTI